MPSLARVVFAGTPDFSVPCLEALFHQKINIVGVYTQPDRPAGRGRKPQASPVKQFALEHDIPVFQPESFKQSADINALENLKPDLMVVVAYGLILPQSVLNIPRLGCINVHASLLPRWRGAAPIQRSIEAGDTQTGVCLMQMDKGLDTGAVFACSPYNIQNIETGGGLHDALSALGATLLGTYLQPILEQKIKPEPQNKAGKSYAHKLEKAHMRIQWDEPATTIYNKIRAFNPWPVATTAIDGKIIRIHHAHCLDEEIQSSASNEPIPTGQILRADASGIVVQTGDHPLQIKTLQKPGGKILTAKDFLNGFALKSGQTFE